MKNPFTLLTIQSFSKTYILYQYFALSPPNYGIGKYIKYLLHVEKIVILSHDLIVFNYIFVISHNCKYEN
jgi:hypothetical protein